MLKCDIKGKDFFFVFWQWFFTFIGQVKVTRDEMFLVLRKKVKGVLFFSIFRMKHLHSTC